MFKQKSWITATAEVIEEEKSIDQQSGLCPTCGAEKFVNDSKKWNKNAALRRESTTLKREVTALSVEHDLLTAQVSEMRKFMQQHPMPSSPASNVSFGAKRVNDSIDEKLKTALEDNVGLNQQLTELNTLYQKLEQLLVESKLQAEALDLEASELTVELKQKNEWLKQFSVKCTKLEV